MALLRIERVTVLPGTLTASTMYIVKSAEAPHAEVYFTNSTGTEARHTINKSEVDSMINTALANFSNITVLDNIAARNALVPDHNILALVLDATGDATVSIGSALYVYRLSNASWNKVSEFESLDVNLTWESIQNKPTSTVATIDDAVAKRHSHDNAAALAKIGEDVEGNLTYNGLPQGAYIANSNW